MHVELLDITPDALNKIGRYASICYNSRDERDSNIKRAVAVKEKGHLACLRFATATFHVTGISRTCSHQFVRSKHLDFLQRSQRYCSEKDTDFVIPDSMSAEAGIRKHMEDGKKLYEYLIKSGVKKEDARFVLPEATTTELIVTGNFQAWLDFIKLRGDTHAQWEVRSVAKAINNTLSKELDNQLFHWLP